MFLFSTKLLKHKNLAESVKHMYSYGQYRRKFLSKLLRHAGHGSSNFYYAYFDLHLLKYFVGEVFSNLELDEAVKSVQIQLKKNLQTYQGLWLALDLPVNGQWTWTNASTQRLLSWNPRKRHFVQRKNWRKCAKENKKNYQNYQNYQKKKLKENETEQIQE